MGFEPMTPVSRGNRLAGGRTRPLCDPSIWNNQADGVMQYSIVSIAVSSKSASLDRIDVQLLAEEYENCDGEKKYAR